MAKELVSAVTPIAVATSTSATYYLTPCWSIFEEHLRSKSDFVGENEEYAA